MLVNRIIGAFTFRKGVYAEVERDQSFTQTAWILVAVVALLSAIGTNATVAEGALNLVISSIIGAIFAVIGFALSAFVISWVGKTFFKADIDFGEAVRVLGLAYVWQLVGFIGILALIPALGCVAGIIGLVAAILGLIAWFVAVKEALDLDWGKTIITVILAWIVNFIVMLIAGLVLGAMGFAAVGLLGAFGGG